MHKIKVRIIGAFMGLGLLFTQAPGVLAVYSPFLSKEVTRIRQDVFKSRVQNGQGSWLNALELVNKANQALKSEGKASGVPGSFTMFATLAKDIAVQSATESFLDGFALLIPAASGISTCLRDDIWELQALQDQVLNEIYKASLLGDSENSQILYDDYYRLQVWIEGAKELEPQVAERLKIDLKIQGIQKGFADPMWFPEGTQNYYVDCPFGSITQAIEEAGRSLTRVVERDYTAMGSISDMWNAAKRRSIKKAADYIAKNQIKISLGGSEGANPEGLISGGGVAGLSSNYGAAKDIATRTLTPVSFKGVGKTADQAFADYQEALKRRELDLKRIHTSLSMGIQLNYVSEESLKSIETTMIKINSKIKEVSNKNSIPEMCNKLNAILARQCKNKQANEPVNCND
jgi:hypothetical protein